MDAVQFDGPANHTAVMTSAVDHTQAHRRATCYFVELDFLLRHFLEKFSKILRKTVKDTWDPVKVPTGSCYYFSVLNSLIHVHL